MFILINLDGVGVLKSLKNISSIKNSRNTESCKYVCMYILKLQPNNNLIFINNISRQYFQYVFEVDKLKKVETSCEKSLESLK